ncbi:MAG: hypothetical protein JWN70_6396 [Planctomycetaceae bacterium]|nr:hypothetical protein [Planctomycetaceae bacterium]
MRVDLRQIEEFEGIKEVKEVGGWCEFDWLRGRGLMGPGTHFADRLVSGTALAAGSARGIDAQNRWLAPRRSHTDCHLLHIAQPTWTLKEFKEFKEVKEVEGNGGGDSSVARPFGHAGFTKTCTSEQRIQRIRMIAMWMSFGAETVRFATLQPNFRLWRNIGLGDRAVTSIHKNKEFKECARFQRGAVKCVVDRSAIRRGRRSRSAGQFSAVRETTSRPQRRVIAERSTTLDECRSTRQDT